MSEVITLDGSLVSRWNVFEAIDSITQNAKSFSCILENSDGAFTDLYDIFDAVVIAIDGTTVFNGRIESITPNESEATVELSGRDYTGDLIGEYIIEAYGIAQDLQNNESAGSDVVIEIADTTGFEVDDVVQVSDDNDAENSTVTAVVANTSITVDALTNSYTTAANAIVTVGELGSDIVDDLVSKYGTKMTRAGIQASTTKFITVFKGMTAFDAIVQIADTESHEFGQDADKDFFYQPTEFDDSGLTIDLGTDSVLDYSFPRPGYDIINRVDVYGATIGGVQVVTRNDDTASQAFYGVINGETIINETITTEDQAGIAAAAVLNAKAWVIQTGELTLLGYETLKAGQLVTLNNFDSVDDGTYLVIEKRHDVPPGTTYIQIAAYASNVEDVIVDLVKRMRLRERDEIDEDAILTKLVNLFESSTHSDTIVNIIQVDINDGYIAGHATNSIVGRGFDGVGSTQLLTGRYATESVII